MAINRTLIEGQRLMREAGKDTRGEAFVKGMSTQLAAGIAERKAITATANKYMEDLGGIENMNLIEPSQRGAVTDFLRTKRDEFSDLAGQYAENPSSEIKDKMDAIKFQFSTVNNQLKSYMDKRKEYLSDRDEGNLQTGGSFDGDNTFFESTYGNPDAAFGIDYKTGKISFTGAGNETRSLEDFGDHTLRNYEGEASASTVFADAKKIKYDGGMFDKSRISQQFVFKHRGQGADEIQSLIQTDLSGDDSDLGFMQQWAAGDLKDKSLYEGFEANKDGTYDASWMLENGNKQQVLDSMGKFVGNVSQNIYDTSVENPERVRKRNQQNQKNNPPNKTDKYGGYAPYSDSGGDADADVNSFQSIPYGDKIARRKSLKNFEEVTGVHYTYKYDKNDEGGWAAYDGTKFVRNMNGARVARIEGLMSANDTSHSDFNQKKVKSDLDNNNLKAKTPGTVGLGLINIEGNTIKNQVNKVANNLYEIFDNNFKNDFNISVVSKNTTGGSGMFSSSSGTSKTPNKIKITSKDGKFEKVYDIGPNATQETVDQINKDFADYITVNSSYQDPE